MIPKSVYEMMRDLMDMLPTTTEEEAQNNVAIWKQLNHTVSFAQQKIIDQAVTKVEEVTNWKDGFDPEEAQS